MGWASWNSFANNIDSQIAMQQAKAIVTSGMKAAGYRYILLDEGWWLGQRDKDGNITPDPKQWPAIAPGERAGDMSNIAAYIHSLGLKAAIYTDAGRDGCSTFYPETGPKRPGTGSEGHYDRDFLQFAKWGFDYVKVDWCGGDKEGLDPAVQYAEIARAVQRAERITGRHLFFSICEWGRQSPQIWAPGVGGVLADMWRTGGDIIGPILDDARHAKMAASLTNVFANFDAGMHPEAQHTGYYNDLDMMVLGMPGMTPASNRVHMSLWVISGAPLIVGADITKLTKDDLAVLTNPEVIAIHQDALGLQCIKVAETAPGLQVWAKPLVQPGKRAVLLLNRTDSAAQISVAWNQLGLDASPPQVRDVWAQKNFPSPESSGYSASVPARDAVLLVVQGRDRSPNVYRASAQVNHLLDSGLPIACKECSSEQPVAIEGATTLVFENVKSSAASAYAQVAYANRSGATIVAEMRVNGQDATKVAFPPTGAGRLGVVALELNLANSSGGNSIEFSAPYACAPALALDSLSIAPW